MSDQATAIGRLGCALGELNQALRAAANAGLQVEVMVSREIHFDLGSGMLAPPAQVKASILQPVRVPEPDPTAEAA